MSDGQNQVISPATAQVGPLPATDFPTIYRLLVKLDYRQQDEIQDLERQLYLLLKENPENINGLIILMQEQMYIVMMEMYMHYLESAGLKEHILIKNYSSRTISNCQQPLMNIWTYAKNLKILELNR